MRSRPRQYALVTRVGAVLVILIARASFLPAQEESQTERDESLQRMRALAEEISLSTLDGDHSQPQKLVDVPVFRYSDEQRYIQDATLWRWGDVGRPVALLKTESYDRPDGTARTIYCLASLSAGLIRADFEDGKVFRSTKPGVELRPFDEAPTPASTALRRRVQMKRLAERFEATLVGVGTPDNRVRMRLLPRPICRYADEAGGLIDGAVFGFTIGTNPDALLVIEAQRDADGAVVWQYGCACMTSGGLLIRLDGAPVFEIPFSPARAGTPTAYDRWMWDRRVISE